MNEDYQNVESHPSIPLQTMVFEGDLIEIKTILNQQESGTATEAISNRLILRNFLMKQRQGMSQLEANLRNNDYDLGEITNLVRSYLNTLSADFYGDFTDDHGEDVVAKLRGDEYFRKVTSDITKESTELATKLVNVDVGQLTTPSDVLAWAQDIRDSVIELIWSKIQDMREDGINELTRTQLLGSIEESLAGIDQYIEGCLPQKV